MVVIKHDTWGGGGMGCNHPNSNNNKKTKPKKPNRPETYWQMQELLNTLWSFNNAIVKLLLG